MATATLADMRGQQKTRALADMKPKDQIAYLLDQKKGEIAKMLPKHLPVERLLKVAQIAATTTPALAKCDVASLVGAIGQCAQMGLEPNTVLGHAYLVPFNTKRKDANGNEKWVNSVQVIVGYKGLIDLARRSGQIVSIAAHEVCENDHFELVYGLEEKLNHTPAMGERGEVIGFYAVAKLVGGGHAFEFMSRHQVEAIRDASQGYQQAVKYKKQATSPWGAHFVEMGRKTVIRRLAKFLPLSIEFQTAAAVDEMAAAGRDQHLDANTIDGEFMFVDAAADGAESFAQDGIDPDTGEILDAPALASDASPTMPMDIPAQAEREPAPASKTQRGKAQSAEAGNPAPGAAAAGAPTYEQVENQLRNARSFDILDIAADLIREVDDVGEQAELQQLLTQRMEEMQAAQEAAQTRYQPAPTGGRQRRGGGGLNLE